MKITSTYNVESINSYKKNINKNSNEKNKLVNDRIEISSEAKKLSETMNIDNNEKIASIKKSIANGTYEINYEELSKRILAKMKG